jgi:hypothetical protein
MTAIIAQHVALARATQTTAARQGSRSSKSRSRADDAGRNTLSPSLE